MPPDYFCRVVCTSCKPCAVYTIDFMLIKASCNLLLPSVCGIISYLGSVGYSGWHLAKTVHMQLQLSTVLC